jgi:hypothetical protein
MSAEGANYKPTAVEIPEALIERLRGLGARFCLVKPRSKDPSIGGKGWQKPENLMRADDPRLQEHLRRGGNYGIVAGFGLAILNVDHDEIKSLVLEKFPETFMWESPGHKAPVALFLSNLTEKRILRTKTGEYGGEILWEGSMAVGPGSIHPNGGVYRIIRDAPLPTVSEEQLEAIFGDLLLPKKDVARVEEAAREEKRRSGIDLDISQVVDLTKLKKQGDEYYGPHPIHGSTTGRNFWVNPSKNVWYCFRHGSGGGPLLWLAVEEGLIRCEDAGPGALRGEKFEQALQKAGERGYIKQPVRVKEEPITISHLNMVEDPGLAGKPLIVEGVVSSTSLAYLAPKEVEATIQDEDGNIRVLNETFDEGNPINIKLIGVNEDVKYRRLKRIFGEPSRVRIRERAWRTIYLVRVRPPVFTLEKRGESIVDERGFEYKVFDVYVVTDQPLIFQPSALVRLMAKPLGSPKSQRTVLLAQKVEFPEGTWRFDEAKLKQLRARLGSLGSVKERVDWILENFERYSGLVGRRNLALAGLLAFFSPMWVVLDGEIQRGWIVALFIGDTTTGKSETLRKLIMLLKGGMLITAETASQVGLTGTATQLEKEGWFVDWGFLVLCDGKLLAIDGAHKLPPSCWAALAEAERSGVVTIAKAAKNRAYARTRQIKIANPVDREAERWTTKPMADFLYPCQALPTVLDKTGIARLDLAVFADSRDVRVEDVNKPMAQRPDPDLELLSEALRWCWSGKAKVTFTDEAITEMLRAATDLYNAFHAQSIPLVSMDMKWKLARLSAALAHLTLSTEDFTEVKVTAEHVKEVAAFLWEEYSKAGLNALAQEERHEAYTREDAEKIVQTIAAQANVERGELESILKFLVLQGRVTRDQLRTEFGLTEHNQLRPLLASLQSNKLIVAKRGLYLTPQLIQLYKALFPDKVDKVDKVEKGTPQKSSGEEI